MATATVSLKGKGYTITEKGYKRITRGPDRHQYAHRVKARDCMKESGLVLTDDMEVHHLCSNRQCDRDFHLLICPGAFHDLCYKVNGSKKQYYHKKHRK